MDFGLTAVLFLIVGILYTSHCRAKQIQIVDANIESAKSILKNYPDDADSRYNLRFYLEVKKHVNGWNHLSEIEEKVQKVFGSRRRR